MRATSAARGLGWAEMNVSAFLIKLTRLDRGTYRELGKMDAGDPLVDRSRCLCSNYSRSRPAFTLPSAPWLMHIDRGIVGLLFVSSRLFARLNCLAPPRHSP
jgi:hypothetical protein